MWLAMTMLDNRSRLATATACCVDSIVRLSGQTYHGRSPFVIREEVTHQNISTARATISELPSNICPTITTTAGSSDKYA